MNLTISIMIKNEPNVMESLQPFIDMSIPIFVFDTGSTDNTLQNIIQSPQIIVACEDFIDYSSSRNRALELTLLHYPQSDFILMIDAEWIMDELNITKLLGFCTEKVNTEYQCFTINLLHSDGIYSNPVPRLFNAKRLPLFKNKLHEIPDCDIQYNTNDIVINWKYSEEGKEKTKQRIINYDIPYYLSRVDYDKESFYYLGQSYLFIDDKVNALHYFNEVFKNNTKGCFSACLNIFELSNDIKLKIQCLQRCVLLQPNRIEPYLYSALIVKDPKEKYTITKKAISIDKITSTEIINLNFYTIYRYILHMQSCIFTKRYIEAREMLKKLRCINFNTVDEPYLSIFYLCFELLKKRTVVLILTSPEYHNFDKIMARYMSNFDLDYFFYMYKNDISEPAIIDGKYIYIKGEETFIPGVLNKTIEVLIIFYNLGFDNFIRLNATTFVNFYEFELPNNLSHIDENGNMVYGKQQNYFGYYSSEKLLQNDEYGVTRQFIDKHGDFPFVSGKFIYLSRLAVKTILESNYENNVMDDVYIGLCLRNLEGCNFSNKAVFYNNIDDNNIPPMVICQDPSQLENMVDKFEKYIKLI